MTKDRQRLRNEVVHLPLGDDQTRIRARALVGQRLASPYRPARGGTTPLLDIEHRMIAARHASLCVTGW